MKEKNTDSRGRLTKRKADQKQKRGGKKIQERDTHAYRHTYINTYMHAYIHIQTCTHTHAYTHTHIHTHIHTYIQAYTYLHSSVCTYMHRYGCIYTRKLPFPLTHDLARAVQLSRRRSKPSRRARPSCEYPEYPASPPQRALPGSTHGLLTAAEYRCAAATAALAAHNADLTAANAQLVAALAALAAENARLVAHCGHCECSECLVSTRSTPLSTRSTVREYSQYPSGKHVLKQRGWDALEYSL